MSFLRSQNKTNSVKKVAVETTGKHKIITGDSLYLKVQDQTKYFELSVVWDSQFVTSFALYMYADCLEHRDLHVHVFGNDVLEFEYPLTELLIH